MVWRAANHGEDRGKCGGGMRLCPFSALSLSLFLRTCNTWIAFGGLTIPPPFSPMHTKTRWTPGLQCEMFGERPDPASCELWIRQRTRNIVCINGSGHMPDISSVRCRASGSAPNSEQKTLSARGLLWVGAGEEGETHKGQWAYRCACGSGNRQHR